jgi:RHS repeat-associated protein
VDRNKNIESITYNHLNLPTEIDFGDSGIIYYIYNALGVKVAKKVSAPEVQDETDYLSGFQYKNGELQFFPTAEGYVNVSDGGKFNYVYNYTDHLGNIRVSYTLNPADGQLKILEENHYYPFGLKHSNYNVDKVDFVKDETGFFVILKSVERNKNQYKYNGKEFQDELNLNLYDYGARNYDPAIGRWMNIDNMAEKYHSSSPYTYANNNPIIFVDIDGNEWFYYSSNGVDDPTWNWHDGKKHNTGVKDTDGNDVILDGVKAVVVFNGSRDEKLGKKNGKNGYIDGEGAVTATVTVYGPDGDDDVHTYEGYTMGSNSEKFGAIDEGTYDGNYDAAGKSGSLKSNWAIENRGEVRMLDGGINPFAPNQVNNGEGYKNGIFIHTSNQNGYAGEISNGTSGISVGCLLISPKDWQNFNNVMSGVKNFKVQLHRKVTVYSKPRPVEITKTD